MLIKEINALIRKAEKLGLTPVIRLNGTSDIDWTKQKHNGLTIFEIFSDIQFYDYTKSVKLDYSSLPENYHVSISYSGANFSYSQKALNASRKYGLNLVIVFEKSVTG